MLEASLCQWQGPCHSVSHPWLPCGVIVRPAHLNFEGNFELLYFAELAEKQPWWHKVFGRESGSSAEKCSMATQLLLGGVTG